MLEKQSVLVVDDTEINLELMRYVLEPFYDVRIAIDGAMALQEARTNPPDIILLDIMMPGMDGYEVCVELKKDFRLAKIPIIFVTAMNDVADEKKGFDVGGVDYITKPISPAVVLARISTHLALYDQKRELEVQVRQRTIELEQTQKLIILRLACASEYKDEYTGNHILRMSHYSRLIALAYGVDDISADMLLTVAPMHDVGKIGIPDRILQKNGKLDADEWAIMRKHPEIGADILGDAVNPLLALASVVALTHHEKWDGSGYPKQLKDEEIPLSGRIVAISDVFDALTSKRPYKEGWAVDAAIVEIKKGAGTHFDPSLIDALERALPEILKIKEMYSDDKAALP
ncbi:response regulator [Herbaspirillum sp. RTI4]|uniref:HD-GYP domain-containing protein n=1 Tax=Herbaspirillum sp. RTI4 TaxID=3048640 RepID=UPI002AB346B7|nr:HD domain-containing phosphohydrolase [Herbaspirillum sp. RTI4]MDY7579525.1 response regulator [Herbaspirillum sp. RTI4]MEA9983153.1 response regulator [Herbaspirillum sp. RTI4]